jgi:polyamine oxidase
MAVAFLNLLKPLLLVYSMLKYLSVLLTRSIQHLVSCIHRFRVRKNVSNEPSPSTLLSPVYQEKSSVPSSSVKHTKVLILGGGMAGVSAAYTLQSNGMEDFLLLEASDRLGGRIKNSTFCGHTIEEGANWIHGVNKGHNPILQLARDCDLKLFNYDDDSLTARDSDGKNVTEGVKKAIADLHKADSRMDDIIDDRGLAGGPPPPDGHLKPKGPLPDCSVAVAERELVGWKASTPEQVTAEYFVHDWDDGIPPSKVCILY